MLHYRDSEMRVIYTLAELAEALRPLLAQPAVPSDAKRIAELEHDLDDVGKERDWFMAQLSTAKRASASAASLDRRAQLAEMQLADARQEIEQLRRQLDDANATAGSLAADLAAVRQELSITANERQAAEVRLARARLVLSDGLRFDR